MRPIAIVTGATSGIGAAVTARLAQRGYRLLLVGRRRETLEELARSLEPASQAASSGVESSRHLVALIDFAQPLAIESVIKAALPDDAEADVLINCAGIGLYRSFLECTADDAARLMNVNYFAAAGLIRATLPRMLKRGRGHIINIASISSKVGPWGHGSYSPAKAALVSLTQTLAAEHSGSGVHFSYVNPGIVDTAYFTNPDVASLWARVRGRAITADAVAKRIVGLIDRPKLELCVPRHYRVLDWLLAIHPSLAHRVVARQSRPQSDARIVEPSKTAPLPPAVPMPPG
jgi:short-subunit dehydrogenase